LLARFIPSSYPRDLGDGFFAHFDRVFGALAGLVDRLTNAGGAPSPELTGSLFECLSYLLRFQQRQLVGSLDSLRKFYGPLLGIILFLNRKKPCLNLV